MPGEAAGDGTSPRLGSERPQAGWRGSAGLQPPCEAVAPTVRLGGACRSLVVCSQHVPLTSQSDGGCGAQGGPPSHSGLLLASCQRCMLFPGRSRRAVGGGSWGGFVRLGRSPRWGWRRTAGHVRVPRGEGIRRETGWWESSRGSWGTCTQGVGESLEQPGQRSRGAGRLGGENKLCVGMRQGAPPEM